MHKRDAAIELWFKKRKEDWNEKWYLNTNHINLVKGDEMSKRTEISYRNLKNDTVEFVGFKNVMTLDEIDKEIGNSSRVHQYAAGRSYFSIPAFLGIRIWNRKENSLSKDFVVGQKYALREWDFFIDFLTESGERYGEIKADIKAGQVQKIVI